MTGLGSTFSNFENNKFYNQAIILLAKFGFKKLDKIIFQNKDDKNYLSKKNILDAQTKLFRVNGSGVDLNYYSYSPKEEKANKKEKVFLMLSRLLIDKGILEYINAAKLIKKKYPNVIFNLAGMPYEGSRAISIKSIKAWEEKKIINYLGLLSDVRESLINCDFYVLPSFYKEGIPRSLMEAMAIGRPLITTDSTGCRECIINNINGYMIKPRDHKALYKAMEKMIIQEKSITNNMGLQSRLIAEQKFNVHYINNKMIEILKV
jgi:glycosyltransferase involved in cell wall biosynthesis